MTTTKLSGGAWLMAVTLMVCLSGCDKLTDTSNAALSVTQKAFNDTKSTWSELFTYHPPQPAPLPQTRYCYNMQTDVVCYDSEQPQLTAKLIGYQDGDQISWVQPGGGSLGASGGEPIALRPRVVKQAAPTVTSQNDYPSPPMTTGIVPSTSGQISVNNLPKPR